MVMPPPLERQDPRRKLARMRTTVNSLETLDSDMREQNLRILKEMEEATVAKITTSTDVKQAA